MEGCKIQLVLVPMTEGERESSEAVLAAAKAWLEAREASRVANQKLREANLVDCERFDQYYSSCNECPPCRARSEAYREAWKARHRSSGKTLRLRNAVLKYQGVTHG